MLQTSPLFSEAFMTKKEIIKIVVQCAKQYETELLNNTLKIICEDKHHHHMSIEVYFTERNFLHLTGVETDLSPEKFFDACIFNRIKTENINERNDGTTELKLSVLPLLITKNLSANMVGDYLQDGINLMTEEIAGNIRGCIGFVLDKISGHYVPNTILKCDIRTRIINKKRIIGIYRKKQNDTEYKEIVYLAKGIYKDTIPYVYTT